MRILYHDDLDGKCAGFLVYDFLRKQGEPIELFSMNYGEPTPFSMGKTFWIVDFSVPVGDMKRLLYESPEVHWIDHHKSSIEKYADFTYAEWTGDTRRVDDIYGIRRNGTAACELTWEYLHQDSVMPDFVKYIGDRDVWAWKYGQQTKHFCNGILGYETKPDAEIWEMLLQDYEWSMRDKEEGRSPAFKLHRQIGVEGSYISRYKDIQEVEYVQKNGIFVTWEGHECYIVNGMFSSEPFEKAVPNADIWIAFRYMPGCYWNVSLYSKKVNVREIAEKHGGGGHDKAAGFQCKKLPFLPKEGESNGE